MDRATSRGTNGLLRDGARVCESAGDVLRVAGIEAGAASGPVTSLGNGIGSDLVPDGDGYAVRVVPLDAVLSLRADGSLARSGLAPGAPAVGSGHRRVVRVAGDRYVRLGLVEGTTVVEAVELRTRDRFGEVALAARQGDQFVLVIRVATEEPRPADQFQVVQIGPLGVARSFAVASDAFADMLPLDEFRLGRDGGSVYQLRTFPDGVRVVRFDLGEAR